MFPQNRLPKVVFLSVLTVFVSLSIYGIATSSIRLTDEQIASLIGGATCNNCNTTDCAGGSCACSGPKNCSSSNCPPLDMACPGDGSCNWCGAGSPPCAGGANCWILHCGGSGCNGGWECGPDCTESPFCGGSNDCTSSCGCSQACDTTCKFDSCVGLQCNRGTVCPREAGCGNQCDSCCMYCRSGGGFLCYMDPIFGCGDPQDCGGMRCCENNCQ